MNTENNNDDGRNTCEEIKMVTAEEALRRELRSIEVPENSEFSLSPTNPDCERFFARVQVKSYEDLQTLGFVPRGLAGEKVHQAITADDTEAYELAGKMLQQSICDCSYSNQKTSSRNPRGNQTRTVYNRIRKQHNPALAAVLSDYYGKQLDWDAHIVSIVRKWIIFQKLAASVLITLFEDIIIPNNATLLVTPEVRLLLARHIQIHSTGRLIGQGSYLKIWANSIKPPPTFGLTSDFDSAMKIAPIWSLIN